MSYKTLIRVLTSKRLASNTRRSIRFRSAALLSIALLGDHLLVRYTARVAIIGLGFLTRENKGVDGSDPSYSLAITYTRPF